MTIDDCIKRQQAAKDEVYDLINRGGTDNLLRAIDVAWREYMNFIGPVMMPTGRKFERLRKFASRMVIDAACALAYERSKEREANG